MTKQKGLVKIKAINFVERVKMSWVMLLFGYLEFDYELFAKAAKSRTVERKKKNEN